MGHNDLDNWPDVDTAVGPDPQTSKAGGAAADPSA